MINMDLTRVAPEIAALLLQRGAGLPPLAWHERQIKLAKTTLDQLDDGKLFGGATLANEEMTAAIRAMLYLWNGWPGDCKMYAQAADEQTCRYLVGFCERQAGNTDPAKEALQQLTAHPVYDAMTKYVPAAVGVGADTYLRRFADIVKLGGAWEPFAYIDLFELARRKELCNAAEEVVRTFQCREFELLFDHCYKATTGHSVEAVQEKAAATRPRREVKRKRPAPTRSQPAAPPPASKSPVSEKTKKPPARKPSMAIGVQCPKCTTLAQVAKTARGKVIRCQNCGTGFKVPIGQAGGASPAASKPTRK